MATKNKANPAPTTVQGSHLTVYSDGTLKWNWDALLKEVKEATKLVPVTEAKVKRTRRKTAAE